MSYDRTLSNDDLAKFFRVPVYMPVDYDGRELLLASRISNIGQNGVFVATPKPLPVGTNLEIRFQLPGVRYLFVVKSTVRWSRGSPKGERPVAGTGLGMGLSFDDLSRAQRQQIRLFIRRFISEMRARS